MPAIQIISTLSHRSLHGRLTHHRESAKCSGIHAVLHHHHLHLHWIHVCTVETHAVELAVHARLLVVVTFALVIAFTNWLFRILTLGVFVQCVELLIGVFCTIGRGFVAATGTPSFGLV